MSRRALTSYLAAAALAFGTAPLLAQENPKQTNPGQRPNTTGSSQGGAVSRPSGGGSSGGGSSTASSPSGGSAAPSSPSRGGSHARPGRDGSASAPSRPQRRAVPRGGARDNSDSSGDHRRVTPGSATASGGDAASGRRAVPAYARPREGRPAIGTAVERRGRPPVSGVVNAGAFFYDPYYRFSNYYSRSPYGFYSAGYGLGLGYFYDPWMGYYSPYGYGGYADPYAGGGYSHYSRDRYREVGALRLKVKPEFGQVYVDGYYVGEVDSFDGIFQKLQIEAGAHRVEIRAPGYETVQFEIMVIPGETVTYKGQLQRIQ